MTTPCSVHSVTWLLTEDCRSMLKVTFLVDNGLNEDQAQALRDTTPWVIG